MKKRIYLTVKRMKILRIYEEKNKRKYNKPRKDMERKFSQKEGSSSGQKY